jgi:nucleoside 2-deoxyribosyltransferase
MQKIYLAGPDVFEKNAIAQGAALKKLCNDFGFEGLFPLDNVIKEDNPSKMAEAIRLANIELILQADLVMANLTPFRGFEPDSGTVYEVGFAEALGKPVFGYTSDLSALKDRLIVHQKLNKDSMHCLDGKCIEDFGLSHNLMFSHTLIASDARSCLSMIQKLYNKNIE